MPGSILNELTVISTLVPSLTLSLSHARNSKAAVIKAPSASGQLYPHNNLLTTANWSKKQNYITNVKNKAQNLCLL